MYRPLPVVMRQNYWRTGAFAPVGKARRSRKHLHRKGKSTFCWHIYLSTKILQYELVEKEQPANVLILLCNSFLCLAKHCSGTKKIYHKEDNLKIRKNLPVEGFCGNVFLLAGGYSCRFCRSMTSDPAHHVLRSSICYIHLFESRGRGKGSGYVSVYGLHPDSMGSLVPYPDLDSRSGSGSKRAKITHKNKKKLINLIFWMFSFEG